MVVWSLAAQTRPYLLKKEEMANIVGNVIRPERNQQDLWPWTREILSTRKPKLQLPPNEAWKKQAEKTFATNVDGLRTIIHKFFASTSIKGPAPVSITDPFFNLPTHADQITELALTNFHPQSEPADQMGEGFVSWYAMACVARLTPNADNHAFSKVERDAGFHYFYLYLSDCKQAYRLSFQPNTDDYNVSLDRVPSTIVRELDWKSLFLFVTTAIQLPNLTGVWRKCAGLALISDSSPIRQKPKFKALVHYSQTDRSYDINVEQYTEILSILQHKSCLKKPPAANAPLATKVIHQVKFASSAEELIFDHEDEPIVVGTTPTDMLELPAEEEEGSAGTADSPLLFDQHHPAPTLNRYRLSGSLLECDELEKIIAWGEPKSSLNKLDDQSGNLTQEWKDQFTLDRRRHFQTFTVPAITAKPIPKPKRWANLQGCWDDKRCMLYYAINWSNLEYSTFQRVLVVIQKLTPV